jgi:hypothetical protein
MLDASERFAFAPPNSRSSASGCWSVLRAHCLPDREFGPCTLNSLACKDSFRLSLGQAQSRPQRCEQFFFVPFTKPPRSRIEKVVMSGHSSARRRVLGVDLSVCLRQFCAATYQGTEMRDVLACRSLPQPNCRVPSVQREANSRATAPARWRCNAVHTCICVGHRVMHVHTLPATTLAVDLDQGGRTERRAITRHRGLWFRWSASVRSIRRR